jgi:hypothetical protein
MLKPTLQSRYWTRPSSARVVQQATLLFKKLPLRLRGRSADRTKKAECNDLLRVAFLATDRESTGEVGVGGYPDNGTLRANQNRDQIAY